MNVGRQHRRQQDAPHQGEPREAKDAPDLDDLAVDVEDRPHDAEIDRKEHPDGDQRHLGGLEDAEPEDEQAESTRSTAPRAGPAASGRSAGGSAARNRQAPPPACRRVPRGRSRPPCGPRSPRYGAAIRRRAPVRRTPRRCATAAAPAARPHSRRGPTSSHTTAMPTGSTSPNPARAQTARAQPDRRRGVAPARSAPVRAPASASDGIGGDRHAARRVIRKGHWVPAKFTAPKDIERGSIATRSRPQHEL